MSMMIQSGRFGAAPVPQSLVLTTGGPSPGGVVSLAGKRWNSGPSASPNWYKAASVATDRDTSGGGKWYFEVTVTTMGGPSPSPAIGIATNGTVITAAGSNAGSSGRFQYFGTGQKRANGVYAAYGPTYVSGDVIGVGIEPTSGGTLTGLRFWKNGVDLGLAYNNFGVVLFEPHFCHYCNAAGDVCQMDILPLVNLPSGYSPW